MVGESQAKVKAFSINNGGVRVDVVQWCFSITQKNHQGDKKEGAPPLKIHYELTIKDLD